MGVRSYFLECIECDYVKERVDQVSSEIELSTYSNVLGKVQGYMIFL